MPIYFSTAAPVASLAGAIRDVLTRPTAFFRQMPADGSYWDSSMLLLVVLAAPLMLGIFLGHDFIPHIPVLLAIATMPFALASAWLWASYLSWAARHFSHASLSTRQAYQLYAYSNVPSLFSWIPGVNVIAGLWSLYLQWKGLTTYAGVSSGWALMILILPLAVLIVSGIILFMLIGVYLSQSPQLNPVMMF
jgi:hypothetical protein